MIIVKSYEVAVLLLFITMVCWGSWANTQKLATKSWPFQLFYWDYALGVVLFSLLFGLTAGSFGDEGRPFLADLAQGSGEAFINAFMGGVIFNIANLLLVASIEIAGMAVAFPVGIGLALIVGVLVNYIATPLGDPVYLFAGVLAVTIAILIDAYVYKRFSRQARVSTKGLLLAILAGILMGFFYRFVAASMSSSFVQPEVSLYTPYTAVFVFSLGVFASNFLWNTLFMRYPTSGRPVGYRQYFADGNTRLHLIGILGGVIWCIGMSLSILSSSEAGFAISYGLGQGATMVAAFWGVFIWREFKGASPGLMRLIYLMFFIFILGIVFIIISRF